MIQPHGRTVRQVVSSVIRRLIPHYCCFCHRTTADNIDLCANCAIHLPRLCESRNGRNVTLCLRCGAEVEQAQLAEFCTNCVDKATPFAHIVAPYRYAFPIDRLIQQLKYHEKLGYGRLLGALLAREVRTRAVQPLPEILLAVPMHPARWRERGFNHAAEIAHWCARELDIPLAHRAARRLEDTVTLAGNDRQARALAIRGAFAADDVVAGRRVAIIDDVLTTGATAGELARELLDTGAVQVQLWAVARTPCGSAPLVSMR